MKKILVCFLVFFALIGVFSSIFFAKRLYDEITTCKHTSFSVETIAPTCLEDGYNINKCTKCSYSYTSDVTPPSGHSLSTLTVEASCSSQGYVLNYCACGYSYATDYSPPSEHSLTCRTVEPTCIEQGYSSYECEFCDYGFKTDYKEPVGHSFELERFLPTSTQAGYTSYVCDCSYSYKGDYVYYSDILESAYTDNTTVLARGLDVSRWNHQIDTLSGDYLPLDWSEIKAQGFDFVILKAGSTKSGIEPTFEMDYEGAKAAGLNVGAYFYIYSTTVAGATRDAQNLLSWLSGKKLEYPIYLDLEDPSLSGLGKNHLGNMCVAFLEELQKNGYYAGLYTNHTWLTTILDTAKMVSLFDIWYARYPGTTVPTWNEEKYGKQLGMWQYTQSGSISGMEGEFDFNYSYKNYPEIMKKWGLNGYGDD